VSTIYLPIRYQITFSLLQPLYLAKLLDYYTPQQTIITKEKAYWYGSVLVLLCFLRTFIQNLFLFELSSFGIKIHVACCSLIYRKCLKLKTNTLQEVSLGQIVNLMSNDVKRFIDASICLHFIWMGPVKFVVGVYFFSVMFSSNVLAGAGLIIVYLLVQGKLNICRHTKKKVRFVVYVFKKISTCRTQVAVKTDYRIRLIDSLINGIQTIKMFTWEKPLQKLVEQARRCAVFFFMNNFKQYNFQIRT
jgi:ATP-binding cassette subfamily C (CFTR/MRP) protein 4